MEPRFTYRLTDLSDCDRLYAAFAKQRFKSAKKTDASTISWYDVLGGC